LNANIEENEKADQLAKEAARHSINTPNSIGLVKSQIHNKQLLKELTQAISGQNNLASSKHHQDNKINPNCDLCDTKENSEHVLLYCPKLDELRFRLNYTNIKNEIYGEERLDWYKCTKLVNKCQRFA
jgi:ribonuclease HI